MPPKKRSRKPKPQAPQPKRKNTKVTGERSESDFQSAAIHRNFGIARPWGDSRRYDFILDNGSALFRVQVKCTECLRADAYETRATYSDGKGRAVYTKKDIDFIAAHVVPLDIFYIIPVEICTPQPMLRFYPHRKARVMRLEPYREAWDLLEGTDHGCVIEINAAADEAIYPEQDYEGTTTDHVGTDAFVRPTHVETAAPGCPPKPSEGSARHSLTAKKISHKKPVHLKPGQAPWPTPPLRILAQRQGKRILPDPDED